MTERWLVNHNREHETNDRIDDARDARIAALEEIIAARWPRSSILKARLRHRLRQNDRDFAYADWDTEEHNFGLRQATAMWNGDKMQP
jgi:hypothetical protein